MPRHSMLCCMLVPVALRWRRKRSRIVNTPGKPNTHARLAGRCHSSIRASIVNARPFIDGSNE